MEKRKKGKKMFFIRKYGAKKTCFAMDFDVILSNPQADLAGFRVYSANEKCQKEKSKFFFSLFIPTQMKVKRNTKQKIVHTQS